MNLHRLLTEHAEAHGPIRVGVIGAGKFSSMFLTQALNTPGIHVIGVADLSIERANAALERTGWPAERYAATSFDEAMRTGGTHVTDSADALIEAPGLEVMLEVTGNPAAGAYHAEKAINAGRHVVMVNVEADCMVGPVLAELARRNGVVYTMAYGDQPALIYELVDWCRTVGFDVVAQAREPSTSRSTTLSTPDTVWDYYGFTDEQLATGDFNAKMFNSFLDGTKSAIEMAAVANATELQPQDEGLFFPPAGVDDLPTVLRPRASWEAVLHRTGTVEVVSSLNRDGARWIATCDGACTSPSRHAPTMRRNASPSTEFAQTQRDAYGSLYRPYHMIGMELGVSVASAALRNETDRRRHRHFTAM